MVYDYINQTKSRITVSLLCEFVSLILMIKYENRSKFSSIVVVAIPTKHVCDILNVSI